MSDEKVTGGSPGERVTFSVTWSDSIGVDGHIDVMEYGELNIILEGENKYRGRVTNEDARKLAWAILKVPPNSAPPPLESELSKTSPQNEYEPRPFETASVTLVNLTAMKVIWPRGAGPRYFTTELHLDAAIARALDEELVGP